MCLTQSLAHSKYTVTICYHYYFYVPDIYDRVDTQQTNVERGGDRKTVTGNSSFPDQNLLHMLIPLPPQMQIPYGHLVLSLSHFWNLSSFMNPLQVRANSFALPICLEIYTLTIAHSHFPAQLHAFILTSLPRIAATPRCVTGVNISGLNILHISLLSLPCVRTFCISSVTQPL